MRTELTTEEKIVYDLIIGVGDGRITQLQIAKLAPQLGSHEKHEGYLTLDSTLRKIRQIIRDLRIKKFLFILSDKRGYWVMQERGEAVKYIQRVEKTARSQAKAHYTTYQCMRRNFGINSDYFETQGKLF